MKSLLELFIYVVFNQIIVVYYIFMSFDTYLTFTILGTWWHVTIATMMQNYMIRWRCDILLINQIQQGTYPFWHLQLLVHLGISQFLNIWQDSEWPVSRKERFKTTSATCLHLPALALAVRDTFLENTTWRRRRMKVSGENNQVRLTAICCLWREMSLSR